MHTRRGKNAGTEIMDELLIAVEVENMEFEIAW